MVGNEQTCKGLISERKQSFVASYELRNRNNRHQLAIWPFEQLSNGAAFSLWLHWMTDCIGWPVRNWRQGLFTDRSSFFCLSRWQAGNGENWTDGAAGVLWFSMEYSDCHGRNGPVVLNGTLSTQRYVDDVIQPELMPYVQGHGLTFQHHNTFPHADEIKYSLSTGLASILPNMSPHWAHGRRQWLSDKTKWPTPTNRVAVLPSNPEGFWWHLTCKDYPSYPVHAAEMQNNAWGWLHPLLNWLHFMVWCTKQHATVNLC